MTKIMHVLQLNGLGGVQELVYNLVKGLSPLDVKMYVFTFSGANRTYVDLYKNNNIELFESPYKVSDIRNILLLCNYIKKNQIEFIHVHNTYPQIFCSLILRRMRHKLRGVVTEHTCESKRRHYKSLRWFDEWTYRPYTKIVAVSDAVNQTLQNWLKYINKDRFVTIVNGIDTSRFIDAMPIQRGMIDMQHGDFMIVSIGRLYKEKGFEIIINALTYLPSNYKLVIIGDGPYRPTLENMVIENDLKERVKLIGFQRDVEGYLKSADLYVSASYSEGFGLTIIEATAAGIPVVASDIPAFRYMIPDNQLFEVGNSEQLATLILGHNYKTIDGLVTEYTMESMVNKYYMLYA